MNRQSMIMMISDESANSIVTTDNKAEQQLQQNQEEDDATSESSEPNSPTAADDDGSSSAIRVNNRLHSSTCIPDQSHNDAPQDLTVAKILMKNEEEVDAEQCNAVEIKVDTDAVVVSPHQHIFQGFKLPTTTHEYSVDNNNTTTIDGDYITQPIKVFNPEAFCEICQKEFCNKYYLQTHKATKHSMTSMLDVDIHQRQLLDRLSCSDPTSATSSLSCALCSQPMSNQLELQSHMLVFHNPFAMIGQQQHGTTSNNSLQHALYMSHLLSSSIEGAGGIMGDLLNNTTSIDAAAAQQLSTTSSSSSYFDAAMRSSIMSIAPHHDAALFNSYLSSNAFPPPPPPIPPSSSSSVSLSALAAALNHNPSLSPCQNNITPNSGVMSDRNPTNKEAYCELCEKEFCNKYFLRTHKLKKHGIAIEYSPILQRNLFGGNNCGASSTTVDDQRLSTTIDNTNQIVSSPFDMSSNKQPSVIVSNILSPPKKIARIDDQPPQRGHVRSSLDLLLAAVSSSSNDTDHHVLPECDLCFKKFASVLTLAKHKFRDHQPSARGIDNNNIESDTTTTTTTPKSTREVSEIFCDICNKEFCSNQFLRQHKANVHQHILSTTSTSDPLRTTPTTTINYSSESTNKPKRQYTTGKNYCDLCNKEVCNKYFLRTHMFKMHGIVIDENKTVIANIDTVEKEQSGEKLRYRCDICYQELISRDAMRIHKQHVHGIVPLANTTTAVSATITKSEHSDQNLPTTQQKHSDTDTGGMMRNGNTSDEQMRESEDDGAEVLCSICGDYFSSTSQLLVHRCIAHDAQSSSVCCCHYCSMTFTDAIEHQVHVIQCHSAEILAKTSVMAAEATVAALDQNNIQQHDDDDDDEKSLMLHRRNSNQQLYHCTYCTYYTPYASNLSSHEKRHTTGGSVPVSSSTHHTCTVCFREYRYAHSLERHKLMHRMSGASYRLMQQSPDKQHQSPDKMSTGLLSPRSGTRRFRCIMCNKRFRTRNLCRDHLFAAHRARRGVEQQKVNDDQMLLYQTTVDQSNDIVSEVVESLHQQRVDERRAAAAVAATKDDNEHTSGSTSPTTSDKLAEGYARPATHSNKPFTVQSFVMRPQNGMKGQFLNELVAHLPVRSLLSNSVEVTFELIPAPNFDAQIKHL